MATRRSRRGQAVEFEASDEPERKMQQELALTRQTVDDVYIKTPDSVQKQEALDAVDEYEGVIVDCLVGLRRVE